MNDATEALVDAARSWSPDQVRRYSDKAHAMINALADAIDPEPQPYPGYDFRYLETRCHSVGAERSSLMAIDVKVIRPLAVLAIDPEALAELFTTPMCLHPIENGSKRCMRPAEHEGTEHMAFVLALAVTHAEDTGGGDKT